MAAVLKFLRKQRRYYWIFNLLWTQYTHSFVKWSLLIPFQLNASATEANARSILCGLGFHQEQLDSDFSSLSGGWRSRCSLASALLQQPDIVRAFIPSFLVSLTILVTSR